VTVPVTPEWTQSPPKTHLFFFFLPEWTQSPPNTHLLLFFFSFFPSPLFFYFYESCDSTAEKSSTASEFCHYHVIAEELSLYNP